MTSIEKKVFWLLAFFVSLGLALEGFGFQSKPPLTLSQVKEIHLLPIQAQSLEMGSFTPSDSNGMSKWGGSTAFHSKKMNSHTKKIEKLKDGQKINVNSANPQELQRIKGVGEKLAIRIYEYRQAHGPFKSAQDLDQVKGIGEKKLNSMLMHITF